jgi:hypothetical protein
MWAIDVQRSAVKANEITSGTLTDCRDTFQQEEPEFPSPAGGNRHLTRGHWIQSIVLEFADYQRLGFSMITGSFTFSASGQTLSPAAVTPSAFSTRAASK